MKVEWHKNTPEDQPESGRDIWVWRCARAQLIKRCKYSLQSKGWLSTSHWAYAEIPEPPEKPE